MDTIGDFLRDVLGEQAADAPFVKALEQKKAFIVKTKESKTDLVRKEILKNFARHGRAPTLEGIAKTLDLKLDEVNHALKKLIQIDLVVMDNDDRLISAYPFSDAPTAHKVTLEDGSNAFALCAIDALGMASMLNQSVNVSSACWHCGQSLHVSVNSSSDVTQAPPGVLVWLSTQQGCDCVATTKCPLINFFCSEGCLQNWLGSNPNEPGFVLELDQAATAGKLFFGDFLS